MRLLPRFRFPIAALLLVVVTTAPALAQSERRPLDHPAYDDWKLIQSQALSPDGRWVLYRLEPQTGGDGELVVHEWESGRVHTVPRGTSPSFTSDSRRVLLLIAPPDEEVREARLERRPAAEQPRNALGILDLATGHLEQIERVRNYRAPEETPDWLAYLAEPAPAEGERQAERGRGADLLLRTLDGSRSWHFPHVTDYRFNADGTYLAYLADAPGDSLDGVYLVDTRTGQAQPLAVGKGTYRSLVFSEPGERMAFLTSRDDPDGDPAAFSVYLWNRGDRQARPIVSAATPGLNPGWRISENRAPSFSPDQRRLFIGTAPQREPDPEPEPDSDLAQVKLDIWHWQDPLLMTQQKVQANQEQRRSYDAWVDLRRGRLVQLADTDLPSVSLLQRGDGEIALAETDVPYRLQRSWESPVPSDLYLVNLADGSRRLLLEDRQVSASFSPEGRYIVWWDFAHRSWRAIEVRSGRTIELSAGLPHPVHNEQHDTPQHPSSYGNAGWTPGDRTFLIYDRYDLWEVDPTGRAEPRNVTAGYGRLHDLRLRVVRLDRDEQAIDPEAPLLLSAFDQNSRQAGFYRTRLRAAGAPERLLLTDHEYGTPRQADEADVLLFTRQSFREFPDLWISDLSLGGRRRISRANPQQDDYRWGTAELVAWHSTDGIPLQGILYKPEDFDPARTYPMIVTFYERSSDNLHRHWHPEPHRSIINYTFYTSRGYLVFLPDIVYRDGYPGESAYNCIMPGVLGLIDRGFVDRENIGIAGHSWGGYQIAFMITRTNLFKAAEAGAPVANMVSAYGGIRWQTGLSRMFQYERTQSRLGDSLWQMPLRYLENSPIFWIDKVETPLLIMHNDNDGHVPWEQGIELFVALRRLQKPAWMVVYNDEPHWPTTWPNKKDWAIRLQQYFDHFLTGAPAPVWLVEGIPAIEKGRTLGRELLDRPAIPPRP